MKGIGRDHAKFSPCATATYRLLPGISLTNFINKIVSLYMYPISNAYFSVDIQFKQPVQGSRATELKVSV